MLRILLTLSKSQVLLAWALYADVDAPGDGLIQLVE